MMAYSKPRFYEVTAEYLPLICAVSMSLPAILIHITWTICSQSKHDQEQNKE